MTIKKDERPRNLFPTKALTSTPATVPAVSEEMTNFVKIATTVRELLAKATEFFRGARLLEQKAANRLATANALKAPKTSEQDQALQLFVKSCLDARKENVEYWEDVTKGLDGLHKLAVAGRKRTADPLEAAIKIGNGLHNAFVDEAERQAKILSDKVRREAEEKAAADRAKELDELERVAVEAEEGAGELSVRERAFASQMAEAPASARTYYAVSAAKSVGYRDPEKQAARLMGSLKILDAIEGLRTAKAARQQASAVSTVPVMASTPTVAPAVAKVAGVSSRTWASAEIFDPVALRKDIDAGKAPADLLEISQSKANEYAKSLGEGINRWAGVRLVKDRKLQ